VSRYRANAYRGNYTELLIGHVALTSFNSRRHHVVRVGAYLLNNFRIGLGLG